VHEDASNDDCVRGYEGRIHNGNNDIESQSTAHVDQGNDNRNRPGEDDRVERNVSRKVIRGEELGEWYSTVTSESPELSGCGGKSSNAACGVVDEYDEHQEICSGKAVRCGVEHVDDQIPCGWIWSKSRRIRQWSEGVNAGYDGKKSKDSIGSVSSK